MQTLQNGIEVPTNSDTYKLTQDLANMGVKANVVIPVASKEVRDALTAKYPGMVVSRTDITGAPLERWDGAKWSATDVPWTDIALSDAFSPANSPGWAGAKYAVRNGWVIIDGAVTRGAAWAADQRITILDASLRPAVKIQGVNVQVIPDGNVLIPAGSVAASFSATWPLF
jgi:hypothetical protein